MIRSKYLSLVGMVISFLLFFGLDRWLANQAQLAQDNADFQPYMLWTILIGLAICAVLYILSWLTLYRSQRSSLISIIFIVVGLLVYAYPVLYQWITWLPIPYLYFYDTPFAYTGIFIVLLGILHLSLPK
jgi:uncharacterized membrane protein